ncbi:hypothetical protein [Helicobacter macacae]|uniref:Outer membrane protein beta-barrel domain-containing protein n=1 Tax=Helicobacter macacae MIT 99-5501 TaxID=1357400 RepID=V8C9A5_9HELI|nr:hypothetical protein [Helicobacter macacae]ETD23973.1 hypothetical protein HMPREF2086_00719 [Helicobacter macacae MIT 99-5501]
MIANKFLCFAFCVGVVCGSFAQMLLAKPTSQTKSTKPAKSPISTKPTISKPTQSPNSTTKNSSKNTQKPKPTNKDSSLKFTLTTLEIEKNKLGKPRKNPHSLFIGAGLGYGVEKQIPKDTANAKDTISMLNIGFRSGYEYMSLAYIGFRVYLDYFLSVRPSGLESEATSTFLANLNAQGRIYSFSERFEFGWLGGLSVGYGVQDKQISSSDDSSEQIQQGRGVFLGNVGVFGIIDEHHRVEILVKLPIKTFAEESQTYTYEDYSFLLMYDYLF